ncbi:hypothetical protein DF186_15825, partial [Enterococcus hirae]
RGQGGQGAGQPVHAPGNAPDPRRLGLGDQPERRVGARGEGRPRRDEGGDGHEAGGDGDRAGGPFGGRHEREPERPGERGEDREGEHGLPPQ